MSFGESTKNLFSLFAFTKSLVQSFIFFFSYSFLFTFFFRHTSRYWGIYIVLRTRKKNYGVAETTPGAFPLRISGSAFLSLSLFFSVSCHSHKDVESTHTHTHTYARDPNRKGSVVAYELHDLHPYSGWVFEQTRNSTEKCATNFEILNFLSLSFYSFLDPESRKIYKKSCLNFPDAKEIIETLSSCEEKRLNYSAKIYFVQIPTFSRISYKKKLARATSWFSE